MSAIVERYGRAVSSSHLELKVEPGDIDVLIAAGMVREGLGTGLLRLRFEFDSISGMPGARTMLTALKSASTVRVRMLALVEQRANGRYTAQERIDLIARLLDIWCDPNCPVCSGRGSIGGYQGGPANICNECSGGKHRKLLWGQDIEQFAHSIEREMLDKVEQAQRTIRRLMSQRL